VKLRISSVSGWIWMTDGPRRLWPRDTVEERRAVRALQLTRKRLPAAEELSGGVRLPKSSRARRIGLSISAVTFSCHNPVTCLPVFGNLVAIKKGCDFGSGGSP